MSSAGPNRAVVDGLVDFVTVSFHLVKIQYEPYQAFSVSGRASTDNEWDIELKVLILYASAFLQARTWDSEWTLKIWLEGVGSRARRGQPSFDLWRCKHGQ
ncbi:hypothetical protein EDD85DRAFT_797162 [Armillaria nabsnona]|nr:hypothetical protein EDD85DRAFT_797162 [Armillaria nabsnona]